MLFFVSLTGSESYELRELGMGVLSFCKPLSESALIIGLTNENPEIYRRSQLALKYGFYSKLLYEIDFYKKVHSLIYDDFEDVDGLPWCPSDLYKNIDDRTSKGIIELFKLKYPEILNYYDGYYSLNSIRFHIRGLPEISYNFDEDDFKEKWKELKKTWKNK